MPPRLALLALGVLLSGCAQTIGDDDLFGDDDSADDDDDADDDDSADDDDDLVDDDDVDPCADHCGDGLLDCGETAVDCGGDCDACPAVVLCEDGCTFPTVAATEELVIVVWGDDSDDLRAHWVCDDGGGWTAHEAIPTTTHSSEFARAETDAAGGLHAVWHRTEDGYEHVRYAVGDATSGSWQASRRVSTEGGRNNQDATVSVDPAGRSHVVWARKDSWEADLPGPVIYRVVTWEDLE